MRNNCPSCGSTEMFRVWIQEINTLKPTDYKYCPECERFIQPRLEVIDYGGES